VSKHRRDEIAAQIAGLQAELADADGGVYEDPRMGRWFIGMRTRARTTTRRPTSSATRPR
jgi:hypothetical protein